MSTVCVGRQREVKVIRSEGPKQSGLLRVAARGRAGGPNGLQTQIGFLLGCPRRPNVVYGTSLEAVRKPVDVAEGEPNSVTASAEENALEHNVMLRLATAWLTVVGKSMGGVIARIERPPCRRGAPWGSRQLTSRVSRPPSISFSGHLTQCCGPSLPASGPHDAQSGLDQSRRSPRSSLCRPFDSQ